MRKRILLHVSVFATLAASTAHAQVSEAWALALIESKVPPERLIALPRFPGHDETPAERHARFASIAHDAALVANDPSEKPLEGGRKRTLATLLAVAYHESGFAHDVDIGPCYRGPDGNNSRCDGGRSACILQLHVGKGSTLEGWTQADLFADRVKCFRAGLHVLQRSSAACSHVAGGPEMRFVSFAGATCESDIGKKRGLELWTLAEEFFGFMPPSS